MHARCQLERQSAPQSYNLTLRKNQAIHGVQQRSKYSLLEIRSDDRTARRWVVPSSSMRDDFICNQPVAESLTAVGMMACLLLGIVIIGDEWTNNPSVGRTLGLV